MVVVVAEKFFLARSLARAYFGAKTQPDKNAFYGMMDNQRMCITWANDGHLFELAEPHAYNPAWKTWNLTDLPISPPALAFRLEPKDEQVVQGIVGLLREASLVVNACDAGREGELIFHELALCAGLYDRKMPMQRLWINDTTAAGLRRDWLTMRSHDAKALRTLREQGITRSQADWLWGFNLTRYASLALAGQAGLKSRFVSVGRVRSPVMAMIADRCREVSLHQPETFFRGHISFVNSDGELCEAKLLAPPELKFGIRDSDWTDREALGERIEYARLVGNEPWTVLEGDNREALEYPPPTFDTTDLQRTANRLFRWSAKHTSRVAQNLYARYGAITYPRTDCAKLPETMRDEVMERWEYFYRVWLPKSYSAEIETLPVWDPDPKNNFTDSVSDHHAIIPTGEIPPTHDPRTGQPTDEYVLWDLIVRRFITAWLPPATVFAASRAFTIPYRPGEHLRALVKAAPVLEANWLKFEDATGSTRGIERKLSDRLKDVMLPDMEDTARMKQVRSLVMRTHPPELFSYDRLLFAMEKAGLGTSATRAEILAELLAVGAAVEDGAHQLIITEEGERIVALLRAHGGEQVLDVKLTAFWEKQLELIGKAGPHHRTRENFLADLLTQIRELGLRLTAPAQVEDIVFCPKTGLQVEKTEQGWRFAGWPDIECPGTLLSRTMKPQEYRDIFAGGKKGSGPFENFTSRRTGNPFKAWLVFDKKEKSFKFNFKLRRS